MSDETVDDRPGDVDDLDIWDPRGPWGNTDGHLLDAVLTGLPALTVHAIEWEEITNPTRLDLLALLDKAEQEANYAPGDAPELHLIPGAISALRAQLTTPAALPAAA